MLQMDGHAPLETSASVVSSDKEYRLRQGDELTIQVVQQAELGTRNGNDIMYTFVNLMDMYHSLWWIQ